MFHFYEESSRYKCESRDRSLIRHLYTYDTESDLLQFRQDLTDYSYILQNILIKS